MEIESSLGSRIFWLILGFCLAGVFAIGGVLAVLQSRQGWVVLVAGLFPIGFGIGTVLWLGRPAWIKVDATEVSYVPPLGSPKVFPRSSVKQIVRVPTSKGSTHLELRDQDNRRLAKIEQGFAKNDVEKLAQFLNAEFTWDVNRKNASLAEMMAMMTPEELAEMAKHMTPEGRAAMAEEMSGNMRNSRSDSARPGGSARN